MKLRSHGYPIPPARQKSIIWVNNTPHLSAKGAVLHRECIALSPTDHHTIRQELYSFLAPLMTEQRELALLEKLHLMSSDEEVWTYYQQLVRRQEEAREIEYMVDRLMIDRSEAKVEPELAGREQEIVSKTAAWIRSLPEDKLKEYEDKLFKKYLSDSSVRTGEGYIKQIGNYLAKRKEFIDIPLPNMPTYERAYEKYIRTFHRLRLQATYDGQLESEVYESLRGYLRRARRTTYGGYPYLANMSDFVSDSGQEVFADWYNDLALTFLFLSPADKLRATYDFIALERVQPGGAESYAVDDNGNITAKLKDNKQRFVQAISAVYSHAYKFVIDARIARLRLVRPHFVADKFGEEAVTVAMHNCVKQSCGTEKPSPDTVLRQTVAGTDYTNYDAHQDVSISNDTGYNIWRLLFPAWATEWLIDPYVKIIYRDARILTPRYGYIQTTGVKSGMPDTNLTDTDNCAFADIYEQLRASEERDVSDLDRHIALDTAMANGDDRFGLTFLTAAEYEKYDWELGYIAQLAKQEITYKGQTLDELSVTYLKTIICYSKVAARVVRTDSVAKLILSRMWPERVSQLSAPASAVISMIMAASRSTESPNLPFLVDFMYEYMSYFRQLVDNEITLDQLVAKYVAEQMQLLQLQRGVKWLKRKGINSEEVIEQMNIRFGYGDEGYRGNVGALDPSAHDAGIAALPQYRAIMSIAESRKVQGILGATYR